MKMVAMIRAGMPGAELKKLAPDDREGRLHEFGRLHGVAGDRHPALGALHFDTEAQRQPQQDDRDHQHAERRDARRPMRQQRCSDHHRHGQRRKDRLADDEVPRTEPESLGNRRAGCKAQQHADQQQQDQSCQQRLVDRPPPLGNGGLALA